MANDISIGLRLNEEEQKVHDWLKDFFGFRNLFGEDSQTLKQAETVAFNVLRTFFGEELKDIFKRDSRERLTEIRALQKEKIRKGLTEGREK
jgi:hypothetical protein